MKISVIVPVFNCELYVERCVRSILAQTYTNLEIICIDDGSSDNSGAILDRLALEDARIKVIHQKNCGLVAVREKGIAKATGDFVGFVDGDDAVDPDMYERLMKNALQEGADISHCGLCVFWPNGVQEPHYGTGKKLTQNGTDALKELLDGVLFDASLCNKLYKRALLKDSCLDHTLQSNEDMLRNYVLFSRATCVVFEDFCGYQYWSRENSMSNDSKIVQRIQQVIKVRQIILEHASQEVFPYAMRLLLSTYVGVVNQNYQSEDTCLQELCKKCRVELKKNKKHISLLIQRQQIAAYLILYAPWLHHLVYKIYDGRR